MALPHHLVPASAAGRRLVDHAREHLAVVAARAVGPLIADGAVHIDGRAGRIAEPVEAGARLTVDPDALAALAAAGRVTPPAAAAVDVLVEDDDLLVVDKPHGMHVHPMGPHRDGTLVGAMLWHAGARPDQPWAAWRPYPAHRLDRATAGLLVFAKHRTIQDALRRLLDERQVERTYRAVVHGAVARDGGTIDAPLGADPADDYRRAVVPEVAGGKPAVTHWRVIERAEEHSVLELRLVTGRTHQLRTHLASIGHPIVGDTLYGGPSTPGRGISLAAVRLVFPHPRTGVAVAVGPGAALSR